MLCWAIITQPMLTQELYVQMTYYTSQVELVEIFKGSMNDSFSFLSVLLNLYTQIKAKYQE